MAGRRQLPSLALITALLLTAIPLGTATKAASAAAGLPGTGAGPVSELLVPLVLVHGLTSGGPRVWGEREPAARGLFGRLTAAGYSPGKTLFAYDYADTTNADYAVLAEVGLGRVVERALAASGAGRVDIVAFGSGALVARYWAATYRGGAAPLRNLVMIAPPNHGQLQADLLKVFYHTDRLVRGGAGTAPAGSGRAPFPGGAGFPDPPVFVTEDQYVGVRAADYSNLYAEYVLTTRLLGGGGSQGGTGAAPPPDYEPWLVITRGDLVEDFIYGAEAPSGPRGLGLTLAYYEILALRVGRQLHLARVVTARGLPPLPSIGKIIDDGWKASLLGYLKQLLLDWGVGKARELWLRERSGAALSLGEVLSGFAAGSPAMSRLVPEHLLFPAGGWLERQVLCNWFLSDWQDREAANRPSGSRYVTIAGSCPNLLGLTGLQTGANDLVVEVASTLLEPSPADVFVLREGLLAVHRSLAGDAAAASAVLRTLLDPSPAAEGKGLGAAGLWEPVYHVLSSETAREARGGGLAVEVALADPPAAGLDGLSALVWLALVPAGPGGEATSGEPPVPVAFFHMEPPGGPADIRRVPLLQGAAYAPAPGPGQVLILGVRLVPDPSGMDTPAYLTLARYIKRDTKIPFSYSVTSRLAPPGPVVSPGPVASPGAAASSGSVGRAEPTTAPPKAKDDPASGRVDGDDPAPVEGSADAPGGEPEEDPDGPSGSGSEPTTGKAEIVASPEPPPLVSVIRVTKMTTTKRESRVFHARWEWDFGDGERHTDDDPSHTLVTVEHTYAAAGTYTARAVSRANDGRLLRELTWTAEVGPGEAISFEAETIVEPVVSITIEGPRKWVTGRPARFKVTAEVTWPPRTRRQVLRAYPGWLFDVVWEKPGAFEVRAAVNVRQSYEFPERRLTVSNTYVVVMPIEIFTPGLTE